MAPPSQNASRILDFKQTVTKYRFYKRFVINITPIDIILHIFCVLFMTHEDFYFVRETGFIMEHPIYGICLYLYSLIIMYVQVGPCFISAIIRLIDSFDQSLTPQMAWCLPFQWMIINVVLLINILISFTIHRSVVIIIMGFLKMVIIYVVSKYLMCIKKLPQGKKMVDIFKEQNQLRAFPEPEARSSPPPYEAVASQ